MSNVLDVLLVHQTHAEVQPLVAFWSSLLGTNDVLIVHGGTRQAFETIEHGKKIFVADPRLRTVDHQRELQSLTEAFQEVQRWIDTHSPHTEFIFVAEYDHLPLVRDLHERQLKRLHEEQADVLAFHLRRVDGTSYAHYLHHAANKNFHRFFDAVSVRADTHVVLSMLGNGSFWTRKAFAAVSAIDEPFPMYNEIYLPTLAHHLGFRVRGYGAQERFVVPYGDRADEIAAATADDAWALHPVKRVTHGQLQVIIASQSNP